MGVLTDSNNIKNECDNETNEHKKLQFIEIICVRIPFEVYDYLERFLFKNGLVLFN
jgi:hypothetical protein